MGENGTEVDVDTLEAYAEGPLTTAIDKMNDAVEALRGASTDPNAYPPEAQTAAQGQADTSEQSMETFAGALETTVDALEGLRTVVRNYVESEDTNTQAAESESGNVDAVDV